jgi:Tfp pilus assembly protein PilV
MSDRSQKCERGYALIEAMVGGAVLMVALGSVLSGLLAANEHVTRAVVDQGMTQHLVDQMEQIRALPISDAMWDPAVPQKGCLLSALPKSKLPEGWTCQVSVVEVDDTAVGGAAGTLKYRRATVTLSFAQRSQTMVVLKW